MDIPGATDTRVCLWDMEEGRPLGFQKSRNGELQLDGPTWGTVMTHWNTRSDFGGGGFARGLGKGSQPEVCMGSQAELA